MTYWDSSALVTLFVEQAVSLKYRKIHARNPQVVTAWHAVPECASAFCRLRREGFLTETQLSEVLIRLQSQSAHWLILASGTRLEQVTLRVLRLHPLRAMDAIHLAAACLIRGETVSTMNFLSEDNRLLEAAAKEGFFTG
ncbi:MAG: type II toxin-antitoxin system VapC family toxin [Verrucomicrobia bacterium]|nr:type II toxin-antitoxin system VapC family toxin [Verrucomicrobiota bacterium]MCH8527559.1 type II toxin-antitoxin system VapC family toxin [Kiritimatiellia bacterium]